MSFFDTNSNISEFFSTLADEIKEDIISMLPERQASAFNRLRELLPMTFDISYIRHAIVPAFLSTVNQGERPSLPMIDTIFTKENALPYYFWGMLYDKWEPNPEEDGLSVFLQGYEKRGDDNRRKKIYYSALTPDLYHPMYREKVVQFFDKLFDDKNAGKPLMRQYLNNYFDMFWDLHLGVKGDAIPEEVREIGMSFNTVLAYRDPTLEIVYKNYMRVRELRETLKEWISQRVDSVVSGSVADPQKTFVYYWIKNGQEGEDFRRKDVVFECFHNFVALSQWGNTIYNFMSLLSKDAGDSKIRECFTHIMQNNYDQANNSPFTPLDKFVMELFRTISPNTDSISAAEEVRKPPYERYSYVLTPHKTTSFDPKHWQNPAEFDPNRYNDSPTSDKIDEAKSKQIGFAQCPFHKETFEVKDGRKTEITNSAFGTVYNITDGNVYPVCDYAGYAPFGFGYRRCPGELLTVEVFKDFLKKVWNDKIEFAKLDLPDPEKLPVGPKTVIDDNIGFTKGT
jgi:cytochrome P450